MNPYQILKVTPGVTLKELKTAWHARLKCFHPDKLGPASATEREAAEETTKLINWAYESISSALAQEPTMSNSPRTRHASVEALLTASGRIRKAFASVDFAEVLLDRLVHAQTGTHAAKKRFADAVSICDRTFRRVDDLLGHFSTISENVGLRLSEHLHATMLRRADEALSWVEIALDNGLKRQARSSERATPSVAKKLEAVAELYPPSSEQVVQAMVRLSEMIERELMHLGSETEQAQSALIEFHSAFRRGRQQLREVKNHSRTGRRSFVEVADAVNRANYITEIACMCAASESARARNAEERHFAANLKKDVEELTQRSIRLRERLSDIEVAIPEVEGQFEQVMVTWRGLLDSHKELAGSDQVSAAFAEVRAQLRGLPARVIAETERRFATRLDEARRGVSTLCV
ncbi:MAG: J domain-containing protein [Bradymonadia bacterium]